MARPTISVFSCLLAVSAAVAPLRAQENYAEITSTDPNDAEFHVMGFADVSYISRDGSDEDGFAIGQAVAHLAASLGDSFSAFGEFSLTARDSEYSVEVERMIVKYDFSDAFKLSAGRYHTPVGYWNSAFHHGAWLQTTTSRPEAMKFGSSIVPIHFVGVLLEGNIPSSGLGLDYKAGFGNGRHSNIARAGDAGDVNGDKAWMLQLNARPRWTRGLNMGVGFYSDEIALDEGPAVEESTWSGYAAWNRESPEIIAEYLHSEHEQVSGSGLSGDVDAWYLQLAYRLPGDRRDWKPYARYERTRVDDVDPLLGSLALDYDGGILGIRWDFNPSAALKAEYRSEEFNNAGRENNFRLQVSLVLSKL